MNLPSSDQYLHIINRNAPGSLATLHSHKFFLKENGLFNSEKGNYAIIFKTEQHSKQYAIRFFLDSEPEVFERYKQIQTFLNTKSFPWKVPFEFLDKEIYLGGEYYPVVKMDWIDSFSLSQFLDSIIDNALLITNLQKELITLSAHLEKNEIGHGNLNMKHIRFAKQQDGPVLKLIDYDSMFIPSFKGKDSISAGTAGFQHPMRLASDFSETIDRFSFWVFLTALEAFKKDPGLWKNAKQNGFNKEEQILFTYRDVAFPQQSSAFQLLRRYNSEALDFYTNKLISFCNSTSLATIEPPRFYEEKDFHSSNQTKAQVNTREEKTNTVLAEEAELLSADVLADKSIVYNEKSFRAKEKSKRKNSGVIHLEPQTQPGQEQELYIPVRKNNKRPVAVIIVFALLLLSIAAYFVWEGQSNKKNSGVAAIEKPILQKQQAVAAQQTVFTSANVMQFLFQLYQSYNKRNLPSILSNYSDSLSQYYDAGAVTKNNLGVIIQDLFIKPTNYECQPDFRTLQINAQGNICELTIAINETIKKDRRSKAENYSSKIQYSVDTSFKILAEKNIE